MSVAIRVENLSKYYRLGTINHGMLYKDIQSWMALKLGKQDPHAQIGADHFADRPEGFWALKDLNFDIQQGDRVGIIGKNGAGKSTLLKILSRITAPTEGVIKIKGRVTSLLEVGTGFHGELTGRENIYLNGAILGMKRSEISKKIDEIIAFSEIEQHIDTPVKRYSSGMYVRLAFAVAAHLESEILIADEVLAVGDAAFQKKALGKMQDLSTGQGRTVLFVSHNMNAVKQLCTKGILLDKGRISSKNMILQNVISSYFDDSTYSNARHAVRITNNNSSNPEFELNSIELLNSKREMLQGVLRASEDYYIKLEFTIDVLSPLLTFEFYFYSEDEVLLFSASPYYSILGYTPKKGKNIAYLKIPKNLFNNRRYRIELQASLFCQKWILEPGNNAPSLFINIEEKSTYNPFVRPSKEQLHPEVNWEIAD